MRDEYTVAAIQMISGSDVQANLETARGLIAQAAAAGAELVALPEYFCLLSAVASDKVKMAEVQGVGPIQDFLSATAKDHGIWLAGGSIPLRSPDPQRVFNAQLVYAPDGSQVARYDKIHLFSFSNGQESYDESLGIVPGERVVTIDTLVGRVGLSICYDLRFPELYRSMGLHKPLEKLTGRPCSGLGPSKTKLTCWRRLKVGYIPLDVKHMVTVC